MTPKEKAENLLFKFKKIDSDSEMFDGFKMKDFYAQRCALIAVNEILDSTIYYFEDNDTFVNYWQEVKKEIEKL
tara:strand:- start:393 stop:614 length:222 start_codon:yes stop_codon:yes gene_type:complete